MAAAFGEALAGRYFPMAAWTMQRQLRRSTLSKCERLRVHAVGTACQCCVCLLGVSSPFSSFCLACYAFTAATWVQLGRLLLHCCAASGSMSRGRKRIGCLLWRRCSRYPSRLVGLNV